MVLIGEYIIILALYNVCFLYKTGVYLINRLFVLIYR